MNFEKFKKILERNKLLSKLIYGLFIAALITFILYMVLVRTEEVPKDQQMNIYIFAVAMLLLSIYATTAIVKLDKLHIINTMMRQEKNEAVIRKVVGELTKRSIEENYAIFNYNNGFIPTPYKAYLYAGEKFIAVNIKKDGPGIVDFGASHREQNRIIKLIEDQFSSIKYKA